MTKFVGGFINALDFRRMTLDPHSVNFLLSHLNELNEKAPFCREIFTNLMIRTCAEANSFNAHDLKSIS